MQRSKHQSVGECNTPEQDMKLVVLTVATLALFSKIVVNSDALKTMFVTVKYPPRSVT